MNPRSKSWNNPLYRLMTWLIHLTLTTLAIVAIAPFVWMACAAFKRPQDVFASLFSPPSGSSWSCENFSILFSSTSFCRWMLNSLFVTSTQTVLAVTFASMGGFALAKYRFPGKRYIQLGLLLMLILPPLALVPGAYRMMVELKWIDSYLAIILPGSVSVLGIFLFRQAMLAVPDELLWAARVDGCGEWQIWWRIALPMVRPMIGAYCLLCFLSSWNSYLWPQIVLQDPSRFTLPIGLSQMLSLPEYQTQYGVLMAGTLLSVLPVILLFFSLQREFVAGLSTGALK